MKKLFTTTVGRLRILGLLEGLSFLLLLGIAVPLKYIRHEPEMTNVLGRIHGGLFLGFVLYAFVAASEYKWKFGQTTWKVLIASVLPFGTFYVDHQILRFVKPVEKDQ